MLGLIYLQYLILKGYSAGQLSHLVHPDVYAAVATFADELAESKPEAIQTSPLVAGHDPVYLFQALTDLTIWGETEFSSLTAILLQQPVYLIEMQDQLFHLQLNNPDGTAETLNDIPITSETQHPLLVIHSGHSHWLTALIPLAIIMSRQAGSR